MSDEYRKLDRNIQRWIFRQGWNELRGIQSRAIAPILAENTDVVISASTASGKTEAFFLPACSAILQERESKKDWSGKNRNPVGGVEIIYVSPLKALINDQYRRLEELSELTDIQITSWHGDSSVSAKKKQRKSPSGIILITPESLEALLINHTAWVQNSFRSLKYIVIDEFHAFIGTERGQHLISLMTRIEYLTGRFDRPIPRVALSATLGDIESVPQSLRPSRAFPCEIIKDENTSSNIKVLLKGFVVPSEIASKANKVLATERHLSRDVYDFCRGRNNLVFANSRTLTESLSAQLRDMCIEDGVGVEFFPHHGSLSKESRENLEKRLQDGSKPTTAICTMTLELGIDIGQVDAVVQATTPHSVASLRQRLGRSGRRDGVSTLRMLIVENEIDEKSDLISCLRLELIQALAMIRLLLIYKWFEPADNDLLHHSTLVHQILASIAQYGGIHAVQLFQLLCIEGPFNNIAPNDFKLILKEMNANELITQLGDGQLALGLVGEGIVSHYTFYAVFQTGEEYRVVYNNTTVGNMPVDTMLITGQYIVLGGKRWQVKNIDFSSKIVDVMLIKGGGKPPNFLGDDLPVHTRISQEMYKILSSGDYRIEINNNKAIEHKSETTKQDAIAMTNSSTEVSYSKLEVGASKSEVGHRTAEPGTKKVDFIDDTARALFIEAVETFDRYDMDNNFVVRMNGETFLFLWQGTKITKTLEALFILKGISCTSKSHFITFDGLLPDALFIILEEIVASELPTACELAESIPAKYIDKFDEYLSDEILNAGIAARKFDVAGLRAWLDDLVLPYSD